MFKKAGMINATMKIYDNDRHEVLNEVNRDEVYEYIYNWLNNINE